MFARLGASALGALRGLMVYGLLVGLSSSVSAVEKMTGADVVRVCSQSSGDAASLSACTFFFQGALDAFSRPFKIWAIRSHFVCRKKCASKTWRLFI